MRKQIKAIINIISIVFIVGYTGSSLAESKLVILRPQSCISEARLRSTSSLFSTNVQFINRKPFRVKVYWIDFVGKRQHYFDLEPSEVRWQQTYTTHPWVVTDSGDNQPCLNYYLPPFLINGIAIIE
jgi:hypothetical protein